MYIPIAFLGKQKIEECTGSKGAVELMKTLPKLHQHPTTRSYRVRPSKRPDVNFKLDSDLEKEKSIIQASSADGKVRYILKIYHGNDVLLYLREIAITTISEFAEGSVHYTVSRCRVMVENTWRAALLQNKIPHSCSDLIKQGFFAHLPNCIGFLSKLATTLRDMSDLHFMHRDLHIGNIMATADYKPVIIDFGRAFLRLHNGVVLDMFQNQKLYVLPEEHDDCFDLAYFCFEFIRTCVLKKEQTRVCNDFVGLCLYISGISCTTSETFATYQRYSTEKLQKMDYRTVFTRSIKIRPAPYKLRSKPDTVLSLLGNVRDHGFSSNIRRQIELEIDILQAMRVCW